MLEKVTAHHPLFPESQQSTAQRKEMEEGGSTDTEEVKTNQRVENTELRVTRAAQGGRGRGLGVGGGGHRPRGKPQGTLSSIRAQSLRQGGNTAKKEGAEVENTPLSLEQRTREAVGHI